LAAEEGADFKIAYPKINERINRGQAQTNADLPAIALAQASRARRQLNAYALCCLKYFCRTTLSGKRTHALRADLIFGL
jgi:hypothetical protein